MDEPYDLLRKLINDAKSQKKTDVIYLDLEEDDVILQKIVKAKPTRDKLSWFRKGHSKPYIPKDKFNKINDYHRVKAQALTNITYEDRLNYIKRMKL